MSSLLNPLGSGPVKPLPVSTPASGHHDAQWYRRVATKASAAPPDTLPEGRVDDEAAWAEEALEEDAAAPAPPVSSNLRCLMT